MRGRLQAVLAGCQVYDIGCRVQTAGLLAPTSMALVWLLQRPRHIWPINRTFMARFGMILWENKLIMAEKHFCRKLLYILRIKIRYKCIFILNYYD